MVWKTHVVKKADIEQSREWLVVDATGIRLGQLATFIAKLLKGKHKPMYTPHMDVGDCVIVVNAEKVDVATPHLATKKYYRHSGYPGGLKVVTLPQMMQKFPARVVERAVKGMLPHNALGRDMYRKLYVYAGPNHPHQAQKPREVKLA